MTSAHPTRPQALRDLVNLARPLDEAIEQLLAFPWDSDEEEVTVGPREVNRVLRYFLDGSMSAAEVERWAESVEGRDDVSFEPRGVIDTLFVLATPEIAGPLTVDRARELLDEE